MRCGCCQVHKRDHSPVNLPKPGTILGQGKIDPFNADDARNLPAVILDGLEYTYEVLWPNNRPGLSGKAMRDAITG